MKNRIVYLFFLILGLYLVVSLSRSILAIMEKGKTVDGARQKVEQALVENNRLNKQLQEAQGRAFIEKQAREKLNMSKKNETVVVIPETLLSQVATFGATISSSLFDFPEPVQNWKKWWGLFF
jgi:cell division protein FtsB